MGNLTHRFAVPPLQRRGLFWSPFLMNEQDGCATLALPAVGGYLQAGLTAAEDNCEYLEQLADAVAVGEIHPADAPSHRES